MVFTYTLYVALEIILFLKRDINEQSSIRQQIKSISKNAVLTIYSTSFCAHTEH